MNNNRIGHTSEMLLAKRLYRTKSITLPLGLFLIGIGLSGLSTSIFKQQNQALAQQYITFITAHLQRY
jgi:hypothetical protein